MQKRFTTLRVIGTIFKILAWIALILGILAAIGALIAGFAFRSSEGFLPIDVGGPLAGIAMFILTLLISIVNFMLYYAVGESIYLFLSIEENTRRSAYFMQQQYTVQQPSYPPSAPSSSGYGM